MDVIRSLVRSKKRSGFLGMVRQKSEERLSCFSFSLSFTCWKMSFNSLTAVRFIVRGPTFPRLPLTIMKATRYTVNGLLNRLRKSSEVIYASIIQPSQQKVDHSRYR